MHQELADVGAREQLVQGVGRVSRSPRRSSRRSSACLRRAAAEVRRSPAWKRSAWSRTRKPWSVARCMSSWPKLRWPAGVLAPVVVVLGDHSAERRSAASMLRRMKTCVHDLAADVLEVDVDAVRAWRRRAARASRRPCGRRRRRSRAPRRRARTSPRRRRCRPTRAPRALAIWPAIEPTAPAAAEITTVSPSFGLPIVDPDVGGDARCGRARRGRPVSGAGSGSGSGLKRRIVGRRHAVLLPAVKPLTSAPTAHVVALRLHHLADADPAHHRADRHGRQ